MPADPPSLSGVTPVRVQQLVSRVSLPIMAEVRTVTLRSGGTLTVIVELPGGDLDDNDRRFVQDLLHRMDGYGGRAVRMVM